MQISFILNQTLDFKTYDEIKKNLFCNATRCMQETGGTQKNPQTCPFILAFSFAAVLNADISHKST